MSVATPASRLADAFARRAPGDLPGLIPYVTAGFPRAGDTPGLLAAAERAGCLAAEVGIPFSDPLADGPTIQRSSQQALANGMSVAKALAAVAEARTRGLTIPVAFMTYVNPVLSFGLERFCAEAAAAGAEAVIVPDLPDDEAAQLREAADAAGLALILLVAPTTTAARLEATCRRATGFVYCVSVTGTTGARDPHLPGGIGPAHARPGRHHPAPRPRLRALPPRAHPGAARPFRGGGGGCRAHRPDRRRARRPRRRRRALPPRAAGDGIVTAVRGIRGATTVDTDDPAGIVEATAEMLSALIEANGIDPEQVAGAWFTTSPDLHSEFPAVAARRLGWVDVPLICGQEMDVVYSNTRSIPRCVRVLILVNTERGQREVRHVYLRGARAIKEELERARAGQLPEPATAAHGRRPSEVHP